MMLAAPDAGAGKARKWSGPNSDAPAERQGKGRRVRIAKISERPRHHTKDAFSPDTEGNSFSSV
jgi:hypothetical protein